MTSVAGCSAHASERTAAAVSPIGGLVMRYPFRSIARDRAPGQIRARSVSETEPNFRLNRGMKRVFGWFVVLPAWLGLGGCAAESETAPPREDTGEVAQATTCGVTLA